MVKDSARTFFSLPSLLRTKISLKLFSTAAQSSFEKNPKLLFPGFSKPSDMLRFLGKYCKLPLRFHFFRGYFPLGRRIFSRLLFLLGNFIMKIIKFGGTPRKRNYIFSIKGISPPPRDEDALEGRGFREPVSPRAPPNILGTFL